MEDILALNRDGGKSTTAAGCDVAAPGDRARSATARTAAGPRPQRRDCVARPPAACRAVAHGGKAGSWPRARQGWKPGRARSLTARHSSRTVRRVIQRTHEGVRWQLQPDFDSLLEPLLRDPGQMVKESPVKQVTRHQLGDRIFYVK